jgi:hypothetical protein
MKRVAFGFAIASLLAAGTSIQGQHGGNPFVDHSDNGETVHVLPAPASIRSPHDTQPTTAPAHQGVQVYSASYGSGNLNYHLGGREIPMAGYHPIYWNSSVANSPGAKAGETLRTTIQNFVADFSNSPHYSILTQYSNPDTIEPILAWAGDTLDNKATQSNITDSKIQGYIASLLGGTLDPNTIYAVYFPSGMKVMMQGGASCSSFCGYHGHFSYNGKDIKYAVFPYTNCRACSISNYSVADILTIVTSHEIREAVTDPDLNAWFDSVGYEADDKCAWHNLYRTGAGYAVQPEYSNRDGGCVVP